MFLQLHRPPVLIDEVQYAPELFTYIKIHVDKAHNPGDFWLTGTQVFKLMRGVQESLAGRVAVLSLTSLSQAEISNGTMEPFLVDMDVLLRRSNNREEADTRDIFERIYRGSMPAIVSGANSNSQIFKSVENRLINTFIFIMTKSVTASTKRCERFVRECCESQKVWKVWPLWCVWRICERWRCGYRICGCGDVGSSSCIRNK